MDTPMHFSLMVMQILLTTKKSKNATILKRMNPVLKKLPMILETPNELPGYAREIALLRELED